MTCNLTLFVGDASGLHSVKTNFELGHFKVQAKVMDNVLKGLGIGPVNWIKIDVEGAEYEVLCGLEETISECKPKIVMEVFHQNVEKVKAFMKEHEYGLIRISPLYFFCIPRYGTKPIRCENMVEQIYVRDPLEEDRIL